MMFLAQAVFQKNVTGDFSKLPVIIQSDRTLVESVRYKRLFKDNGQLLLPYKKGDDEMKPSERLINDPNKLF